MAYTPIGWQNDQAPAINATNLNKMDLQIKTNSELIENLTKNVYSTAQIDEKLNNIHTKAEANQIFANAIKGTTSGYAVGVGDVSPVEHNVTLKASSKNMLDITKAYFSSYTTSTGNVGNLTTDNNILRFEKLTDTAFSGAALISVYFEKGTYTISCTASSDAAGNMAWGIFTQDNATVKSAVAIGSQTTVEFSEVFTITKSGLFDVAMYIGYSAEAGTYVSFENLQLEKGETKTDYTPFVDVSSINITGYKGNIANIPDIAFSAYTYSMVDNLQWYVDLPIGATYTISADANVAESNGGATNWRTNLTDGRSLWLFNGNATGGARKSTTHTKNIHFELSDVASSLIYCGNAADPGGKYYKNFTVNIGDKDLGYDAYEPQTYTPDADGNIKLTSFSPNMSFVPDTDGVILEFEYNCDINKAFAELTQAIINLGGTV